MKVTLKNLGKLREATIDLSKDLILLTGPNNTSKTYVAHAIYGLCQSMVSMWVEVLKGRLGRELPEWKPSEDPRFKIDLREFVEQHMLSMLHDIGRNYARQLPNVFAAREELFVNSEIGLEPEEVAYGASGSASFIEEEIEIYRGANRAVVLRRTPGKTEWIFEKTAVSPPEWFASGMHPGDFSDSMLSSYVYFYVMTWVLRRAIRLPAQTYILTAERAAIQLFSRELSAKRTELVDRLLQVRSGAAQEGNVEEEMSELLGRRARRYPLAINDGLRIANDLLVYGKDKSPWAELADKLERQMLGGSLKIEESGEMQFFPVSSRVGLGLHLASSSVKSLAGLTFFLRHIAGENHFLIIDEPELNLHPDNQRRVARLLGRLARSGIKVLISTHSDYVIREINNLIMLSADEKGEVRERLGYDEAEVLKPTQVGAYLFDAERAHPIEVQPTGIEVETIDREINSLNAVSQDIYFSLFGKMGT